MGRVKLQFMYMYVTTKVDSNTMVTCTGIQCSIRHRKQWL